MTSESFFALMIGGMIALFFGAMLLFAGYRFFWVLIPILGFFFGFGLGAQTVTALFGDAFLATITSWVVGFCVAVIFAMLSYLFYFVAVAMLGGAVGYALAVGLLEGIGLNFGFLVWIIGIVAAIAIGAAVLVFNVQKYVVIAATAVLGAGIVIGTFLYLFGGLPSADLSLNAVRTAVQQSALWMISFLLLAFLGIVGQFESTRSVEVETYNRFAEMYGGETKPVGGPVAV
jgi:Domain of unknown function (DUF4203)